MKKLLTKTLILAMSLVLLLGLVSCKQETAADWDYIKNKGEMIVGITYFEPMNYLDVAGNLTGFETEFAQAVASRLGITVTFQEINWNAKETELNAKNIDCIWNGLTISDDRKANMSISAPYMSNKQILVVQANRAEALASTVDGLSIVAETGSAGETVASEDAFFSSATLTPVDTQAKAIMEVASGTADAAVVDYVLSIGMIGEGTDYASLVALEERAFGAEEYGIAFRKDDTQLTAKVNEAIKALYESGELAEIAKKYKLEALLVEQ